MIKHFCDFCGVEIGIVGSSGIKHVGLPNTEGDLEAEFEVCEACESAFSQDFEMWRKARAADWKASFQGECETRLKDLFPEVSWKLTGVDLARGVD